LSDFEREDDLSFESEESAEGSQSAIFNDEESIDVDQYEPEFGEEDPNDEWAARARSVEDDLVARIPEHKLRPRLEPTRRAVELLGDPQKAYRVIHVTGTNGKTSTTRFIERILREHGLRTGRFTSPHLVRLNERMAIDGEPVSNERLYTVWQEIKPLIEIIDAQLEAEGDTRLTFFEALAVLGFAVFADAPVDVLVLEVGMGGEWDSTNVADGDVAVFTPISMDHAERLGDTIAEIATTKSGIIKEGAYVLSSAQPAEAMPVLQAKAAELAEAFASYGPQFELIETIATDLGQTFSVRTLAGEYHDIHLPVHGEYQAQNAALAIAAVEAFMGAGNQRIMDDIVRASLADASSPGRLQVIHRDPLVILDAAHNPGGAESLAHALATTFGKPYAVGVLAALGDKDATGFFELLDDSLVEVVITQSDSPRAVPAEELAATARKVFGEDRVHVSKHPLEAIELAKSLLPGAPTKGAVVVTGSITLIGQVLKLQQQEVDADVE
jgi:dihydrofolate synthase/folylpolyglutamate synthase